MIHFNLRIFSKILILVLKDLHSLQECYFALACQNKLHVVKKIYNFTKLK